MRCAVRCFYFFLSLRGLLKSLTKNESKQKIKIGDFGVGVVTTHDGQPHRCFIKSMMGKGLFGSKWAESPGPDRHLGNFGLV